MKTVLVFLVAYFFGWVDAHYTVSQECERLGGFYVGKNNFTCTKGEDK